MYKSVCVVNGIIISETKQRDRFKSDLSHSFSFKTENENTDKISYRKKILD